VARDAILNMQSSSAGFGPEIGSKNLRADITALATMIFALARNSEIDFGKGKEPPPKPDENGVVKKSETHLKIEQTIKSALKLLECDPKNAKGLLTLDSAKCEPGFDGTTAGLTIATIFSISTPETIKALEYFVGEDGKGLSSRLVWNNGGDFNALTVWLGTFVSMTNFDKRGREWVTWSSAAADLYISHQRADGAWDAAGSDAQRGTVWRAALAARVLAMVAPPPLPFAPAVPAQPPAPDNSAPVK